MKRRSRIAALSLAAAMTMSMGVAANAADVSSESVLQQTKRAIAAEGILNQPEATSVYAGETITGTAQIVKADGTVTEEQFTVAIPEGATNEEMSELSADAAREAVGLPTVTSDYAETQKFARSTNSNGGNTMTVKPASSGATKMCSGTIPEPSKAETWDYIQIDFFNVVNLTKLNVRAVNGALPSSSTDRNCYQTISVSNGGGDFYAYFEEGNPYGKGTFKISTGATMSIYASSGTSATGTAACIAYVCSD